MSHAPATALRLPLPVRPRRRRFPLPKSPRAWRDIQRAAFCRFMVKELRRAPCLPPEPPPGTWDGSGPVPDSAVVYCRTPRPPRTRWRALYEGWDGVARADPGMTVTGWRQCAQCGAWYWAREDDDEELCERCRD